MEKGKGDCSRLVCQWRCGRPRTLFHFLFSIFLAGALASCGTPGEPVAPQPLVPEAVTDLTARQEGDAVVLTFTLPRKSTEGDLLASPPDLEILRGFQPAGQPPRADAARLVMTVPSALVDTFLADGRIRFRDPWKPDELARHANEQVVYVVRTRASERRASDNSNPVALQLFPVPETITDMAATLTEPAIELRWTAPARTTAGQSIAALGGYRVYRAEVAPGEEAAAAADPANAKLLGEPELVGVAPSAGYRDAEFEFGRLYIYFVRSVAQYDAGSVESANSVPVVVSPKDVFSPAAPQGLVAVLVPATESSPAAMELSWSLNPETDLAGYHVYRSEEEGTRKEKLNREILLTPTFRDTSVQPGRRYVYTVTAVDRAGNESPPSGPVTEGVPPRGQ
ncbi:MAG TPA: fibronectin type III domain-containing protein [Candidatus Acidoferrales bacterium]